MSASTNNNNMNDNNDIAPDMPEMRSVLIRSSAPAMPQMRSFSDTKQAPQYAPIVRKQAPIDISVAPTPTPTSTITWQPSSVPQLPDYYPLERSHVTITNVDCAEVAHRISECLRNESIAATFTENKAVAETLCHTQFYVQLFESNEELIVEVQRRTGCSYTFRQCSKAILRAAKGEQQQQQQPCQAPPPLPPSLPTLDNAISIEKEAIDIAFDLLAQERVDAQLLGMQSLLSCNNNTTPTTVFQTDQLAVIIKHATSRQSELRRDALTVLANCWSQNNSNTMPKVNHDLLLRTLIADLTDQDLHVAHQAARCLTAIWQSSSGVDELKALLLTYGSATATRMALREGQSKHALLEQETTRLLQMELEH
mmetsp:Transcript_30043/g.49637  ORF Transcript_30043/g.49637 Transcript_30043/m.49637 type:complete len:368 (-) Transcript_30043:135-1238(-)